VTNRAPVRRRAFHGDEYYQQFLETLDEAHQRFGVQVFGYCLLPNQYHLLIKTPEANLSRAMRHINGVYTQRYNRLKNSDGVVFRGRYKSVLVEEGSFQLQLSRYVHRLPVDLKYFKELDANPWTSLPAFTNTEKAPSWLYRDEVLFQLDDKRRAYKRYQAYVEEGNDDEIKRFFERKNTPSVMGSEKFRNKVFKARTQSRGVSRDELKKFRMSITSVIKAVADEFDVKPSDIKSGGRLAEGRNIPRWVAMYLCQDAAGHTLSSIAKSFGFKHYATVSTTIGKLKQEMAEDAKLARKVSGLLTRLTPQS
jgi:REP element-mobilizing transposase RayT